jgi:endonuclease/exonuclease/phosphatase family metal-dependent hydrolase
MTYNVHRCLGTDGVLSPERIAEVIASCRPDIVGLQELDVRRRRTGGIDQVERIARLLRMDYHFHPALRVMDELYGDAILTARPSTLVKAGPLPGRSRLEPRGALWAEVDAGEAPLQVINTHLGLRGTERRVQIERLLGPDWLGSPACRPPLVLMGDLNAPPGTAGYRRMRGHLADARRTPRVGRPRATFPARLPFWRLDHVFVGPGIEVLAATTFTSPLARIASDHLPVIVDLRILAGAPRPPPGPELGA